MDKKKILVVEDEKAIADILVFNLGREGYDTMAAYDGAEGLHKALTESPDLILLDVMLPEMDGFEVCRRVRAQSDIPIIMLTAREEEADKVMGLELGADDYITKPFSMRELMARVKANMRRTLSGEEREKPQTEAGDGLRISRSSGMVYKNGRALELSAREFDILCFLAASPGRVFSREELMEHVWGYDYYGDLRAVDVAIRRLREKIEPSPSDPKYVRWMLPSAVCAKRSRTSRQARSTSLPSAAWAITLRRAERSAPIHSHGGVILFRSLHMKLVLILVLMIVSVMAVVGTFLINSVSTFYIDSFYTQMQSVFTTDTIRSMQEAAAAPDAEGLRTIIDAHRSRLGIDDYRNYYILDGEGRFVDGSNPNLSVTRTRNIIAAMAGEAGTRSSVSDSVMDIAVPLDHDGNGTVDYIVYIADDKQEISDLSWRFFQIVMQAMMFGLLAAILLSFLLSKTITTPIERITEGARSIAEGNFDQDLGVQSSDEIGELTRSFNYMARRLKTTVGEVQGERDKLNTLFLHMTDGVAAFTTDGRLIHMNPATENLLGVRMQDSLTFDEMFEDLEMVGSDETAMRTFLTSEITRRGRVLSVTLAPYGALDGKGGVIAVLHDITEQRRLDDARREFVANVSHELRTPLTAISGWSETLLAGGGEDPEEVMQGLTIIQKEAGRLTRMVEELLDFARIESGRMKLEVENFDLSIELYEAVYMYENLLRKSGIRLNYDEDVEANYFVNGDRHRMKQVFLNILDNAAKYGGDGKRIDIRLVRDGGNLVATVRDYGQGIPEAELPFVKEKFYKGSSKQRGSGIGLAVTEEIVALHGGTLDIASAVGEGTTVTVTLPSAKAEEALGITGAPSRTEEEP